MELKEDSHYEKINSLYSEYASLLGQENVETRLQTLKNDIVIEVCKVFYLNDKGLTYLENSESNAELKHQKKIENQKYSYEIYMKALECIKTFSKTKSLEPLSNDEEKIDNFSGYVISSVNRRLNFLKAQDTIKDKNSGVKISREKILLVRRLKNEDMQLKRLGITNREKREAKLMKLFKLTEEEFKDLMSLALGEATSLDATVSDDEDSKTLGDFQESGLPSAEQLVENKEVLENTLNIIQNEWEQMDDTDRVLADALTADILGIMFGSGSVEEGTKHDTITYENLDIIEKYTFFNQDIVHKFFTDPTYKLPTQSEIGMMHGGMTKGGISKKLSRFYEKLKAKLTS